MLKRFLFGLLLCLFSVSAFASPLTIDDEISTIIAGFLSLSCIFGFIAGVLLAGLL